MKVQFLQDEQFYLITNSAVARNPIFLDPQIQAHFKEKMDYYLSPICEISAFDLNNHEFKFVVKLKPRTEIEQFHLEKYGLPCKLKPIPETTYIFSQQMSNLQVSLVKKLNFKYGRTGTLMAGRFKKYLLESPEEVLETIQKLHSSKQHKFYSKFWESKIMTDVAPMNSKVIYSKYEKVKENPYGIKCYLTRKDLVGRFTQFKNPELFPILEYHQRRLYSCLDKHLTP